MYDYYAQQGDFKMNEKNKKLIYTIIIIILFLLAILLMSNANDGFNVNVPHQDSGGEINKGSKEEEDVDLDKLSDNCC